jgi:hypothetical protein
MVVDGMVADGMANTVEGLVPAMTIATTARAQAMAIATGAAVTRMP